MQLREYLQVLRRRWWLILLLALVMAGSTFVFARLQTPIYRSSIRVLVSGKLDYGAQLAMNLQLRSLATRVLLTSAAEEVDRRLRLDLAPEVLLERIKAEPVPDVTQIQIVADDVDPARAQQLARAFADVFVEQQTAREQPKPRAERIDVEILDRPTPPTLYWPQTRVLVAAAGLIGLVLGVLLAFTIEYLDDTFKTPDDVDRYLGLPTVGVVPRIAPDQARTTADHRPPVVRRPTSPVQGGAPR